MPKPDSKSLFLVNSLAFFGYFSCMLQWLWVSILILPSLLEDDGIRSFILPSPQIEQPTRALPAIQESSIIMTIAAIIVTLIILVITAIILVRLPIALVTASKKIVNKGADVALPIVTHRKKIPSKQKKILSLRLRIYIKLALVVIPLLLLSTTLFLPSEIDRMIIVFIGSLLAAGSLIWFTLEYAAARIYKIPLESVA